MTLQLIPRELSADRVREQVVPTPLPADCRPQVRGKFLFAGDRKLYLRGVTYGPFRPDEAGVEYHTPRQVRRDFQLMARHGINTVRVYTVPPRWLLDEAAACGLRVMVGLPWEQHIAFLSRPHSRDIKQRVRAGVRACAGHPALLAFAVGNEIPAPIVRWYGRKRIERFLEQLCRIVKKEDPQALVTYVNYPTTEYLQLSCVDFVSFNVYLESQEKLSDYLARLQNQTADRPLVMAEVGLDSQRNGEVMQAEVLDWQIRTAFAAGCAGVYVFAWTDEWFRGGAEIQDWSFGLTTREREPKPALSAVADALAQTPFDPHDDWPRMSVVVCTYNGSRTLRETCDRLMELDYPDYEVVVINDGSTDRTLDILRHYDYRVITVANGGLSAARNVGMRAATGEIVVYLDDDAYPDPHWLYYLAHTFRTTPFVAVGGPNLPLPDDGMAAQCVAHSPGGPNHVLFTDREAEHIPGCNMAIRRDALMAIGGFDEQFRIAGDDVDVCWRLQDRGGVIGFHGAAMVWHHRRDSIRGYLKQQRNYGRAEGMLAAKWPQ